MNDETNVDPRVVALTLDLDRDACVTLLESASIQCYDEEDIGTLRTAVAENYKDGTLDAESIVERWEECATDGARRVREVPK